MRMLPKGDIGPSPQFDRPAHAAGVSTATAIAMVGASNGIDLSAIRHHGTKKVLREAIK
jgi:hypothetical protein